jgi:hypothetical protein
MLKGFAPLTFFAWRLEVDSGNCGGCVKIVAAPCDKGLKGSSSHSRGVRRGVVIPLRAVGLSEGESLVFLSAMEFAPGGCAPWTRG